MPSARERLSSWAYWLIGSGSIMAPAIGLLSNKLSDIMYLVRGSGRVFSENIGLPQAVPDSRKADYIFRDAFMVLVTAATVEVASRIPDVMYLFPMMFEKLKIKDIPGGEYKKFPNILKSYMGGNLIKPESYGSVPRVLKESGIAQLERDGQFEEARRAEALANHLEQFLNPKEYLARTKKLSAEEQKYVLDRIKKSEKLVGLFDKAQQSNFNEKKAKLLDLKKALQNEVAELKKNGVTSFKSNLKNPIDFKALASKSWQDLGHAIHEPILPHGVDNNSLKTFEASKQFRLDNLMQHINSGLILPLEEKLKGAQSPVIHELKKLLEGRFVKASLEQAYNRSVIWLKLPVSLGLQFLTYGIIANYFDAKYLQPYEREITLKRGDVKEMISPSYIGMIPGTLVSAWALRSPLVQRFGYLNSVLFASVLGLGTWAATTWMLFKQKISKPRVFKPGVKNRFPTLPDQPAWTINNNGQVVPTSPYMNSSNPIRSQTIYQKPPYHPIYQPIHSYNPMTVSRSV